MKQALMQLVTPDSESKTIIRDPGYSFLVLHHKTGLQHAHVPGLDTSRYADMVNFKVMRSVIRCVCEPISGVVGAAAQRRGSEIGEVPIKSTPDCVHCLIEQK
jgi:hypothetical protein